MALEVPISWLADLSWWTMIRSLHREHLCFVFLIFFYISARFRFPPSMCSPDCFASYVCSSPHLCCVSWLLFTLSVNNPSTRTEYTPLFSVLFAWSLSCQPASSISVSSFCYAWFAFFVLFFFLFGFAHGLLDFLPCSTSVCCFRLKHFCSL